MKRLLLLAAGLLLTSYAGAQDFVTARPVYDWKPVAGTGALTPYVDQVFPSNTPPSSFTIDWTVAGTAPSACTFRIEGSSDGVNWSGLDATSPATDANPCTSSFMVHFTAKPVRKVRILIVTYVAGDGTTQVKFHYTAGG